MAELVPPSQWVRVQPLAGGYSRDPAADAQLRRLRDEQRQRWQEAADAAPRVRAYKARIEQEWLPSMERDVADAERQLEVAKARMLLRIVARDQDNQVATQTDGTPVLFHLEEDEADDEGVVDAKRRLRVLRTGRDGLRVQLRACDEHLMLVDYQRPPED